MIETRKGKLACRVPTPMGGMQGRRWVQMRVNNSLEFKRMP